MSTTPASTREFITPEQAVAWLRSHVQGELQNDSRQIQPGDGFIAWSGANADAAQYVPTALQAGATACLIERRDLAVDAFMDERVASYLDLKQACAAIAAAYYEHPSQALEVIAVTGTNGKTSTVWWLSQALEQLKPCAFIGTLGVGTPESFNTVDGLTTPSAIFLQRQLRHFKNQGLQVCALEASSIGLAERRLDATHIALAIWTNFTQDHLDYHGDMQSYLAAKLALFDWPSLRSAVINIDDAEGAKLAQTLAAQKQLDVWTLSLRKPARLQAQHVFYDDQNMVFDVVENPDHTGEERHPLRLHLIGEYNIRNVLGVIAAMRALGIPLAQAVAACQTLTPPPGRMEFITQPGQPLVVVDYAHTPDALEKTLLALRPVALERGGQLWCVFGCGGERDNLKRPLMGAVAHAHADHVVITNDNPRHEKPELICSQILQGIEHDHEVQVELDRARAIAGSIAQANANDVVLLAGKGHERYQDINGTRHAFADQEHAQLALKART